MYKHLQPIISLLIHSSVKGVQDEAYVLAKAAMLSTGAFDRNHSEIDAWFLFLPGYSRDKSALERQGSEIFWDLSRVVISFFCDAVSMMGNNLYKYLDNMRNLSSKLQGIEGNILHQVFYNQANKPKLKDLMVDSKSCSKFNPLVT